MTTLASLLNVVCCPLTHHRLKEVSAQILSDLNQKIVQQQIFNEEKKQVTETFTNGLVTEDENRFYPIVNQIPVLLVEESISLKK